MLEIVETGNIFLFIISYLIVNSSLLVNSSLILLVLQ